MAILNGRQTPRGVGITRTVSCQMQAMWGNFFGEGNPVEIPNPYPISVPGRPLRKRHVMYIKYFEINHASAGTFYLVERPVAEADMQQPVNRGYPIQKVTGSETRRQKRLKQVKLPMTGLIRIYSGAASFEAGSSLEY